jgi:anti-anti-sigma factor
VVAGYRPSEDATVNQQGLGMKTLLTCRYDRGTAVITVGGHLRANDLDVFRHYVDEALDRSVSLIAVELGLVLDIDASALAMLITAHNRAMWAGTALTLVAPNKSVIRRLERSHLGDVFPVVDQVPAGWAEATT